MNSIPFPLRSQDKGPQVADLQVALQFLKYALSNEELQAATYGESTRLAVYGFQKKSGLEATGEVDEATAKELNAVLKSRGAFDKEAPVQQTQRLVAGQVRREKGQALAGVNVRAFHVNRGGSINR